MMDEGRPVQRPISAEDMIRLAPPPPRDEHDPLLRDLSVYDDQKAAQEHGHALKWANLTFWTKYALAVTTVVVGVLGILAILSLVGFFVYTFVIHYMIPTRGWLTPTELARLGEVYGNFTKVAAPIAMITNAWLVAQFGSRQWLRRAWPWKPENK